MWTLCIVLGLILVGVLVLLLRHHRSPVKADDENSREQERTYQPDAVAGDEKIEEEDSEADRLWIASVDDIIDANIANAEFSVEDLGRLAGMSRSNLYKRVKAITGLSPLEYLRDRRVKKGRQLLAQATGKHVKPTLAEIAYQVGMSPRQFSKYIKQE